MSVEGVAAAALGTVDTLGLVMTEGVIMLGASLATVLIFRRLGLGSVLGYLIAGMIIGPYVLGLVGGAESKLTLAELGVVLLLFLVGLELNPERLWRLKREIFGLGLLQVIVTGIALAALVYLASGFTLAAALALGLPLALSSTAQVLPGLKSSGRINSPFGERAFSILLMQDLAIVPLITIIAAMSRAPADPSAPPGYMVAVYTVGAIVGLVLAGRFILRPLLRLVGRLGEQELFIVVALFTVMAAAALMHALHLSTALGAFIAGVMLADSPYRHEIEADVDPFRQVLLAMFFVAVGMMLDLHVVMQNPVYVVGMAIGLVLVKTFVLFWLARAFGMESKGAIGLALLLSQAGEFGFVLFKQAQEALLIEPQAASLYGAIVTLSMATTPFLMMIARRYEMQARDDGEDLPGPEQAERNKVLIIGFGRFGQVVAQMLHACGAKVTLIDKKALQVERANQFEHKVYYGDGMRMDLLRRAGADDAELILYCTDDAAMSAKDIEPIIHAFPQAKVFARVFDRQQLIEMDEAGLAGMVREVYESSVAMGIMALQALERTPEEIHDIERAFRLMDKERLGRQIAEGDIRAGIELRFLPGDAGPTIQDVLKRAHRKDKGKGSDEMKLGDSECG